MSPLVIYHRSDFDGFFCQEIARRALGPHVEFLGWDYGDAVPTVEPARLVYMLDISVEELMAHPNLIWIDHHKSAIERYPSTIPGYRIDGVAACRLAWQWFFSANAPTDATRYREREVSEPLAVRLAGEYDIWDKRDPRAELFQHGLRSMELTTERWDKLLTNGVEGEWMVNVLLQRGEALQYSRIQENASIIRHQGFTVTWEGLTFIACNAARFNSHLFTAALQPEHDACLGFCWDGGKGLWKVSMYGVPGKPDIDLQAIAVRHGGGGHKQACGFQCRQLPFPVLAQRPEMRGAA